MTEKITVSDSPYALSDVVQNASIPDAEREVIRFLHNERSRERLGEIVSWMRMNASSLLTQAYLTDGIQRLDAINRKRKSIRLVFLMRSGITRTVEVTGVFQESNNVLYGFDFSIHNDQNALLTQQQILPQELIDIIPHGAMKGGRYPFDMADFVTGLRDALEKEER